MPAAVHPPAELYFLLGLGALLPGLSAAQETGRCWGVPKAGPLLIEGATFKYAQGFGFKPKNYIKHDYNASIWEVDAGRPEVQSHPQIQIKLRLA